MNEETKELELSLLLLNQVENERNIINLSIKLNFTLENKLQNVLSLIFKTRVTNL